ncbi:MAG: hypothetical protein AAGG48_10585 [Planctomycetota bacterium]
MAIEERDREDLLRDGRTMVMRGECEIDGSKVLVGFRRAGQASLYCGPDPVFQFNLGNELRRAFFRGKRLAARDGALVELTRDTRGGNVQLRSTPIDQATHDAILLELDLWLQKIRRVIENPDLDWNAVGMPVPVFHAIVQAWIQGISENEIAIAQTPDVG